MVCEVTLVTRNLSKLPRSPDPHATPNMPRTQLTPPTKDPLGILASEGGSFPHPPKMSPQGGPKSLANLVIPPEMALCFGVKGTKDQKLTPKVSPPLGWPFWGPVVHGGWPLMPFPYCPPWESFLRGGTLWGEVEKSMFPNYLRNEAKLKEMSETQNKALGMQCPTVF